MRISDWSSDVCSSDLRYEVRNFAQLAKQIRGDFDAHRLRYVAADDGQSGFRHGGIEVDDALVIGGSFENWRQHHDPVRDALGSMSGALHHLRSEERSVGKVCVRTCRSRRSTYHKTNNKAYNTIKS